MTRNRIAIIGAAAFAAMVIAAVVLLVTLRGSGHSSHAAASRSSSPAASSSTSNPFPAIPSPPTDTTATSSSSGASTSTSAAPVTQDQARATIVDYLNDVNVKDRVSAGKLICAELYDAWLQNIDAANSDFNFVVTNARFIGSAATPSGGQVAHYALTFNDNTTSSVSFTVVDESGPKICGESRA